jgi:hypothetical protein
VTLIFGPELATELSLAVEIGEVSIPATNQGVGSSNLSRRANYLIYMVI